MFLTTIISTFKNILQLADINAIDDDVMQIGGYQH